MCMKSLFGKIFHIKNNFFYPPLFPPVLIELYPELNVKIFLDKILSLFICAPLWALTSTVHYTLAQHTHFIPVYKT